MIRKTRRRVLSCGVLVATALAMLGVLSQKAAASDEETSLHVVVTEAANNEPIFQAQLTLQFQIPQRFKQPKWIAYSAKTDKKGKCTFRRVNKGPIRLLVTADGHQSYGKQYEIQKDNPVIEVKLRKPQPQI
ncbi:MAG TPA: carboxypeptidase-like regulatory domain-containing protein [Terriglobia bacterium]|nr:carboxypeptidase-like regulatory domain-containing protein [Terriglobia bacterium]